MTQKGHEIFAESEEFLNSFARQAIDWVKQQRVIHRINSRELTPKEKAIYSGFFDEEIINSVYSTNGRFYIY